ncbi:helix-turn-helix domain-containing protein [Metabacillus fastidiosus]|uniref:helix-turn-helix domain-containing protein n=1 Tax=Metabacillus fastidiosus TaxID=1458 RepID=UPI003D2A14AD
MKTRIDVIASEEAYLNLSTFDDIEEMNITVREYRDVIKTSIKRADVQARLITLLEVLKRYSCKQIGVSYMCKNTIAKMMELSYKTIQRLMKKLEQLGMIRQIATKRKSDMRQTANAVSIVPVVNEEVSDKTPSEMSDKCPTNKTKSISLKQNIINKRKSMPEKDNVDNFSKANFIAEWVPSTFADLASSFYTESKTVEEFWRVVRQCNGIVNYETNERAFDTEEELNIAIRAFKAFVMKVKSNKKMKNIFGYFNGIVNKLMDKHYEQAIFDMQMEYSF